SRRSSSTAARPSSGSVRRRWGARSASFVGRATSRSSWTPARVTTAGPKRRKRGFNVGQKTPPYGFRLVYNKTWHSRWYGDAKYADTLHEDLKLRLLLKTRLSHAGVS